MKGSEPYSGLTQIKYTGNCCTKRDYAMGTLYEHMIEILEIPPTPLTVFSSLLGLVQCLWVRPLYIKLWFSAFQCDFSFSLAGFSSLSVTLMEKKNVVRTSGTFLASRSCGCLVTGQDY